MPGLGVSAFRRVVPRVSRKCLSGIFRAWWALCGPVLSAAQGGEAPASGLHSAGSALGQKRQRPGRQEAGGKQHPGDLIRALNLLLDSLGLTVQ